MKRYFLLSMLLALCSLFAFADVTGEVPATSTAYYIYNVGQQKYLNISGTSVTLSSTEGTQFTVGEGSVSGTYTLTSTAGTLSTTKDGDIVNCSGYYDNWKFSVVSTDENTYALGVLEDEDYYSYSYIYYSEAISDICKNSAMPDCADGEWMFVSEIPTEEPVELKEEVTLNPFSDDYTYKVPEDMDETVDVTLYHTPLLSNEKNAFCVPFNMDYEQLKAAFGPNFSLYYYRTSTEDAIYYAARSYVKAGVPYVIIPDGSVSESDEEKAAREEAGLTEDEAQVIKIKGVPSSSFVEAPKYVTHGIWTMSSTFEGTNLSNGNYCVFDSGRLYRVTSVTSDMLLAFQAYFYTTSSGNVKAAPREIFIDDENATDIDDIESNTIGLTIYNVNGQIVRENAEDTEGLPKGIYIINGKKTLVK